MNITLVGAAGRMGLSMIRDLVSSFPDLRLVGAVERPDHPLLGQDVGTLAGVAPLGVALSADKEAAVRVADVALDFTFHACVPETATLARRHKTALLVGTTALAPDERALVESAAADIPVMIASNLSVGVNVLAALVKRASSVLGPGFDIEVVEMHHRHKKDAPSGTAVTLAKAAADGRGLELDKVARYGRQGVSGERSGDEIAIHALRGGDIVGDHRVLFAADGELLELSHRATSRTCLSAGALRAARWLATRGPGLHTMAEMLGLD